MTTWIPEGQQGKDRLKAEYECLFSWNNNLKYSDQINLHIQDDGSKQEDYDKVIMQAHEIWKRGDISWGQQKRKGVGASLNNGIFTAFKSSEIVLNAVDDWELLQVLDLDPWVNFLKDPQYEVGMVRFFAHPDLTGTIKHIPPHGWAMKLDWHHYVFSFRPCLWNKKFFEVWGEFEENRSALGSEEEFNNRLVRNGRLGEDAAVWLALPELWRPFETGSLADMVPQ